MSSAPDLTGASDTPVGASFAFHLHCSPERDPLRLFCLPHAGGGASSYHRWGRELLPSVEVWAYTPAGRERRLREAPLRRVDAIVNELLPLVAEAGGGRFAVFGHSMGALVAFELVRRLHAAGGPRPLALLVAGMGAPHCPPPRPPIRHLPDEEFLAEVERYGGLPSAVLQSSELLDLVLPGLRADFEAAETYRYVPGEPLDVHILAMAGDNDLFVPLETLNAWSLHTTVGCEVRPMEGGHFFVHERPDFIDFLAGRIKILSMARATVC